jgi:hypothetical protein
MQFRSSHVQVAVTVSKMPDTGDTVTWAPDDGWRYHPKHIERFTDINKMYIVASKETLPLPVYVFLLLCMFCSVYSVFVVPIGTIRLPWLRFFYAFSSVVRQMPGYNLQKRGTAGCLPKLTVLFCVLRVCFNTYCTTVTGCQPNCS